MVHTALFYHAGGSGATGLVGLLTQVVAMRLQKTAIRSPRLHFVSRPQARCGVLRGWKKKCPGHDSESERLRKGGYRARPVERHYIPKADGSRHPIGIPVLEDKIVQRATVEVLNAVYEGHFKGFSYGFRPGRSQHRALEALYMGLTKREDQLGLVPEGDGAQRPGLQPWCLVGRDFAP